MSDEYCPGGSPPGPRRVEPVSQDADVVVAVRMHQVNVNDEEVTLVGWHVADGARAVENEPLCEVETSKAVGDVPAPASGILRRVARVGDVVAVGEVFACIGPSSEAIDQYLASGRKEAVAEDSSADSEVGRYESGGGPEVGRCESGGGPFPVPVGATAGAVELARRYGIDLADVAATGKVRRSDVERVAAQRGLSAPAGKGLVATLAGDALPPALADAVSDQGELSDHQRAIADHLARSQSQLVTAHVTMDVSMAAAAQWIEAKRGAGVMTGPIPILLHAAAAAIAAEPELASFRLGRRVYAYRSIDVAYTARSSDGRLFTPVVRRVDQRLLDELAAECSRLNMAVFRGQLGAADMSGGCLTVSVLSEQPVRLHVGLQNAYQSAILTSGAIRDEVALVEDKPVAVPTIMLALSYDHGLMDGWRAAAALEAAKTAVETVRD